MKICFSYHFDHYSPQGDVLQFLILLKAIDNKVKRLIVNSEEKYVIDCVLPFEFTNGQDGFSFQHVRFHKSQNLVKKIVKLDKEIDYDFIFIRGRPEAKKLIDQDPKFGNKLLFLLVSYTLDDSDLTYLFGNTRIIFLQTEPSANRFKAHLHGKRISLEMLDRKIQVLPQYVEPFPEEELPSVHRSTPLQLIQVGIIRSRHGLPMAIQGIQQIHKHYPDVYLHLVYPYIASNYRATALTLINIPEVKKYGQKSMWDTKKMILWAGIGMALNSHMTPELNSNYAYLSRILECLSLGVPVITTRTDGNVHLFGKDYPLFVDNEQDILRCYQELTNPTFYKRMSNFAKHVGSQFIADDAVENFWSILTNEVKKGVFNLELPTVKRKNSLTKKMKPLNRKKSQTTRYKKKRIIRKTRVRFKKQTLHSRKKRVRNRPKRVLRKRAKRPSPPDLKAKKPDSPQLTSEELLDKIIESLNQKKPLSVISVGHTESFVMAQYSVFPETYFMNHDEAKVANKGIKSGHEHRGIRFPNIKARDEAVEAVRKADIVGYITVLPAGVVAEKVFEVNNINPKYIFDAYLRRVIMFSQKEKFKEMLRGRKILLISSIAEEVRNGLDLDLKRRLGFEIVGTIGILEYEEIPTVKQKIAHYDFDLCLLAAGINAVILAPYIAETYGKVAVDLGSGLKSLATGEISMTNWLTKRVGLDRIMKM